MNKRKTITIQDYRNKKDLSYYSFQNNSHFFIFCSILDCSNRVISSNSDYVLLFSFMSSIHQTNATVSPFAFCVKALSYSSKRINLLEKNGKISVIIDNTP